MIYSVFHGPILWVEKSLKIQYYVAIIKACNCGDGFYRDICDDRILGEKIVTCDYADVDIMWTIFLVIIIIFLFSK